MESSSLLPISTGNFRSLSSFNNRSSPRSSPRSRRESPVLPTHEPPSPPKLRPSFFFRSAANMQTKREIAGRGWWGLPLRLGPAIRKYLLWIGLILAWFYVGFYLHIRWSGDGPGIVGRNESQKQLAGGVLDGIQSENGGGVFGNDEMTTGAGLAEKEEVMRLSKTDSRILEALETKYGILEEGDLEKILETEEQDDGTLDNVEPEANSSIALETEDPETGSSVTTTTASSNINDNREPHLGRDVGPFDEIERQVWGSIKTAASSGRAPRSRFAESVRAKNFVVVFHELSMTGAPLAILELATKIVRCGGRASAVVLNKRGGLYDELVQRGIAVVRDKEAASWKAAEHADVVVASSASCTPWIEKYLRHSKKGGELLIWWIMENRREYFDKSKLMLSKAHALVFLSEAQLQLWRQWAAKDGLVLPSMTKVISLSVNEELAAVAGLNDEVRTVDEYLETRKKRESVRDFVRKGMGLLASDYLVISLSSINPGKGQLLMLRAAVLVLEGVGDKGRGSNLTYTVGANSDKTGVKLQEQGRGESARNLKILLGSVGSKSNKAEYLEKIDELVDTYPNVAEILLWTEATVHVAPLYAAADAYLMNAQGIGETFGRVTVEAMAFGLPVLGTDAGGTKEIVQANITGLLHPTGQAGISVLAQNLRWLLTHPELGVEMGKKGRARVQALYREAPMYEAFATVFPEALQERGG